MVKRPLTLGLAKSSSERAGDKSGPVLWWKLDETQGATAANAAGGGLEGRIQGTPHWAPGEGAQAGALEFDGAKNWVEAADSSGLDFENGLTISTWVKVQKFKVPTETLIAKGEGWRIQRQGKKGALAFLMRGLTPPRQGTNSVKTPVFVTKRNVDDNQWHHVAVTYDGKRVVLYLDGAEEASAAMTGSLTPNNAPITIGENHSMRGRCFNGWLDDARVYQRALDADEIKALAVATRKLAQQ